MFDIFSFNSFLLIILSIKPFLSKNSDLWKPSGRSCPIVCLITLGPAKPISALGSDRITSPSIAILAEIPPVVGSVNKTIYNPPFFENFASFELD